LWETLLLWNVTLVLLCYLHRASGFTDQNIFNSKAAKIGDSRKRFNSTNKYSDVNSNSSNKCCKNEIWRNKNISFTKKSSVEIEFTSGSDTRETALYRKFNSGKLKIFDFETKFFFFLFASVNKVVVATVATVVAVPFDYTIVITIVVAAVVENVFPLVVVVEEMVVCFLLWYTVLENIFNNLT
jgi:hypothetical protein